MFPSSDLQRHAGKFYGKYSGEVTDNADQTKTGRIRVKVPTIFGPEEDIVARPCLPYGHFFVPAVGSKVWVEFEAGDTGFPIWVGVWYPENQTPAPAAIDPPENRVIQTSSGHTIEIFDKSGEEKIILKHKDNSFISIDKNGSVLLGNKNGSTVVLNAKDRNLMILEEHGNVISLSNDSIVLINKEGAATLEMKGDKVQIAGAKIILRGTQVVLGEGATEAALLGTTFTGLFNAHTHATAMGPSGPPIPPLVPMGPHLAMATVVK